MAIDVYVLLLAIGIFQGVALLIILSRKKFQRHRYLAVIIFILTFSSLVSFLWRSHLIEFAPHLLGVSMPMLFLLGPCYYFYNLSVFDEKIVMRKATMHFIPAFVCLLAIMPFYLKSAEVKLDYIQKSDIETMNLPLERGISYSLVLIHLISYIFWSTRFIYSLQASGFKHFQVWKNWVKALNVGLITLTSFSAIVFVLYAFTGIQSTFYRDVLLLVITFFIHLIAFGMIYKSNLGMRHAASRQDIDQSKKLIARLAEFIETDKPFLNPQIKMSDVAKAIDITPQKLSELINSHYRKNFADFINEFRIREAKSILLNRKYDVYDMDGIAQLTGFQSRTNLTRVFKKHTNTTPSEFKNSKSIQPT